MDCSDAYVKMCQKAEEIQRLWSPAEGDHFVDDLCHVSIVNPALLEYLNKSFKEGKRGSYTWLPRQDQLQEMVVSLFKGNCYWMMEECYKFMQLPYPMKSQSMEQIWLTFVMQQLYQKQWLPEKGEWIKKGPHGNSGEGLVAEG
jgi:hypothetical protein